MKAATFPSLQPTVYSLGRAARGWVRELPVGRKDVVVSAIAARVAPRADLVIDRVPESAAPLSPEPRGLNAAWLGHLRGERGAANLGETVGWCLLAASAAAAVLGGLTATGQLLLGWPAFYRLVSWVLS